MKKQKERVKVNFDWDALCQNKKYWQGYTVFKFTFNGMEIEFVTLKDAEAVLDKIRLVLEEKKHE